MVAGTPDVMERLKVETRDHHTRAETHELQKSLARGDVSREVYAAYLGQLMLVHRVLERELKARSGQVPAIGRVLKEHQIHEPALVDDLEFFSVEPEHVESADATARLVTRIESLSASQPLGLLGMHYVLEGSTNGGKFLAKSIRRGMGLNDRGTRYFDPYGERQRELWAQFKVDMSAVGFSMAEADLLVQCAKEMFDAIYDIADDVWRTRAEVVVRPVNGVIAR